MRQFDSENTGQDIRADLLFYMEKQADFEGMGRDALILAAKARKVDVDFAFALFDNGNRLAIAQYYWQMRIENFTIQLQNVSSSMDNKNILAPKFLDESVDAPDIPLGTTQKVAFALNFFFRIKNNLIHDLAAQCALHSSTARLLMPAGAVLLTKNIWNLSDSIWKFAGDQSTNSNYYSKRFLLAQIIMVSLMYYFQDKTDDKRQTQNFIADKLQKVVIIGKIIGRGKTDLQSKGEFVVRLLQFLSPYAEKKINFSDHPGSAPSQFRQNGSNRWQYENKFRITPLRVAKVVGKRIISKQRLIHSQIQNFQRHR